MPPTIVLVHGAFAESASWDRVMHSLHGSGQDVIAAANPLRSLAADAEAVSDLVRTIDGPVVLVAHSYGGAVISNVAADAGEITGLVYVNGFAPDAGENCFQLAGMFPGSTLGEATVKPVPRSDGTTDLYVASGPFHDIFCADVPASQAALMAAMQRPAHPGGAGRTVGRASAVEARAVMVPDRRGGPHHPPRAPALHGRPCRGAPHGRAPRCVARGGRLAARRDRAADPRSRRAGARGRVISGESEMSVYTTLAPVVLEPASQAFIEATANPPFPTRPAPPSRRPSRSCTPRCTAPEAGAAFTTFQGAQA